MLENLAQTVWDLGNSILGVISATVLVHEVLLTERLLSVLAAAAVADLEFLEL